MFNMFASAVMLGYNSAKSFSDIIMFHNLEPFPLQQLAMLGYNDAKSFLI